MKNKLCCFLLISLWLAILTVPSNLLAAQAQTKEEKSATASRSEWDELVKAAQKEGTVAIYSSDVPPAVRDAIIPFFKTKYKINVEFLPGRPAELIAKLGQERRAGLYAVDIGFFGDTDIINELKPLGICQPLDTMLALPEVKDPKNWRGGKLPFLEGDKIALILVMMANSFYQRNVNLVKENEIVSSQDLLNPKWKEKMVLSDPSISGASNAWFTWMLTEIMGKEKGLQFMKDLVDQKPVMSRDNRQMVEWLARGKFSISIGVSMAVPAQFIQMGAPIAYIDVKEPRSLSPSSGVISVFKDAPHPHAARLFLNWMLTKEGSSIFSKGYKYPSLRTDVPMEGILPIMAPRPDDVYATQKYKDFGQVKGDMRKVAADVFAPLLK